jgi:hypothetical protein
MKRHIGFLLAQSTLAIENRLAHELALVVDGWGGVSGRYKSDHASFVS